jgi:hypothetical protein
MIQAVAFDCFGTLVGFGVRRDPYDLFVRGQHLVRATVDHEA